MQIQISPSIRRSLEHGNGPHGTGNSWVRVIWGVTTFPGGSGIPRMAGPELYYILGLCIVPLLCLAYLAKNDWWAQTSEHCLVTSLFPPPTPKDVELIGKSLHRELLCTGTFRLMEEFS